MINANNKIIHTYTREDDVINRMQIFACKWLQFILPQCAICEVPIPNITFMFCLFKIA